MSDSKTKRKPIQDGGSAKKRAKVLLRALQPCSFKARRYEEIENVNLNTPMSIANLNWVSNWGVKEALREKLTNMIDQARWVSSRFCNGAEVHFLEGKGTLIVYVGELLLAQAKWGVRRANYFADEFKEGGSKKSRAEGTSSVKETMVIEMTNYSSSLRWDSFFIGRTTKKHDKCVIGKHGEGLSGACVALTRIGCNLTAMCSKGGYIADIFRFHNDSVCVQLVRRPTSKSPNPRLPQDTVRFKVVFDPEMEVNVEELLNEIRLPLDATKITTTRGELLVGPACKGRYFNRGIYVEEVPKSQFGYNFYDPDKDLLQGRDRNSHTKHIGKECGTILSEAILQDPEVCKKVMEMFLYQGAGAPTADGMTFESFEDIKGGEFILPEAREALRKCAIAERCEGKEGIFCASSTGQLELICKAQGARIIYSHAFLHNHQLAVRNFHLTLTAHAAEFDPCCRIGTMSQRLLPLLKTQSLRRSSVKVPMVAFWRVEDAVYVTGSDALSHSGGLTLLQEYSIHNSLLSCGLSLLDVLNIVRVLKGEVAENEDDSDGELRGEKEEECEEDAAAKSPTALVNLTRTENEPDTPDGAAVAAGSSANTSMEITDDESEEDAAAGAADTSTDLSDSASQTDAAAAAAVSGDSAYDSGADEEGEADYSSDSDIDDSDWDGDGDEGDEVEDPVAALGASAAPVSATSSAQATASAPTSAPAFILIPLFDGAAAAGANAAVGGAATVRVNLLGRHPATGILLYSDDPRGDHHGQVMLDSWVRNPAARARLLALTSLVHIAAYSVMGAPGDALAPAVLLAEQNCLSVNLLSRDTPFSGAYLRKHLRCLLREVDLLNMEF